MHGCHAIDLIQHLALFPVPFVKDQFFTRVYFLSMSHQNAGFDLKQQIADPAAQCISDPGRELIQIRAMLIEVLQAVVISVKCHGLPGWLDTYNDFDFFCAHAISPEESSTGDIGGIAMCQFREPAFLDVVFDHF